MSKRAGIVGAGIAGAHCAGLLAEAGWEVDVFEKSRGAGGRLSTRRLDNGWATLGAPLVSAARAPFRAQLEAWAREGGVSPVKGGLFGRANKGWAEASLAHHYRFTVEPSRLVRQLSGSARVYPGTRVTAVAPHALVLEDGRRLEGYDRVVVAVPVPQAVALLEALPTLRDHLAGVHYRPVWSFLMRWEGGPAADVIRFDDHLLAVAVRQLGGGEGLWAVHSSHGFAETYLEAHEMEASTRGASALMGLLGLSWPVEVEASHLWRYARPENPVGHGWLEDAPSGVVVVGDGISGVGVEHAWESGMGAAQAILRAA